MSFRVAVLALDGRGGGEVVVMEGSLRNGSRSTECEVVCLRGGGFWSELRTLGGVPELFFESDGGGGAARDGW